MSHLWETAITIMKKYNAETLNTDGMRFVVEKELNMLKLSEGECRYITNCLRLISFQLIVCLLSCCPLTQKTPRTLVAERDSE